MSHRDFLPGCGMDRITTLTYNSTIAGRMEIDLFIAFRLCGKSLHDFAMRLKAVIKRDTITLQTNLF